MRTINAKGRRRSREAEIYAMIRLDYIHEKVTPINAKMSTNDEIFFCDQLLS
jgi:hypothetical protein